MTDVQDTRIHEARLAQIWAHAYASDDLPTVLDALYRHEINVGMQSFFDDRWKVWLGDMDYNGTKVIGDAESAHDLAAWLVKAAEDYYPLLRTSRLMLGRDKPSVSREPSEA